MTEQETRPQPAARTPISRRNFNRGFVTSGLFSVLGGVTGFRPPQEFDYVIVGAGPGGGPLAARLAEAGFEVALLEAGGDPVGRPLNEIDPSTGLVYTIPALLAVSAEHPLLSWSFFVNHYENAEQQARDSKFVPGKGVLYPRGSGLGGSTVHDALFFVYPHDADFDAIADTTGDESWRADQMRGYFERLERCTYCTPAIPGHGTSGYFPATRFDEHVFALYPELHDIAFAGAVWPESASRGNTTLDINHPLVAHGETGAFRTPQHISGNARISVREHLVATRAAHPDRLFLFTDALVSKVLIRHKRAQGVEILLGRALYAADENYDPTREPERTRIYARREVILSAGAFNTPQLLKLSGIGPAAELRSHGIDVVQNLPGVGANLQDRYEVAVNVDLAEPTDLFGRCRPTEEVDPCAVAYVTGHWEGSAQPFFGPYASNGFLGTRIARSTPDKALPDLFLIGAPALFRGYFPGFSQDPIGQHWTWVVLKAHTENRGGTVELRSTDPRDVPLINFHYFEEGTDTCGDDLDAVARGVKMVRGFLQDPAASQHLGAEVSPGPDVTSDAEIAEFVRNEAWGHHASCTAKIGSADDHYAVLDSRFRVRGIEGLRVVDASVFPRTPGFFPIASILMISEKAADVIIEDAHSSG